LIKQTISAAIFDRDDPFVIGMASAIAPNSVVFPDPRFAGDKMFHCECSTAMFMNVSNCRRETSNFEQSFTVSFVDDETTNRPCRTVNRDRRNRRV